MKCDLCEIAGRSSCTLWEPDPTTVYLTVRFHRRVRFEPPCVCVSAAPSGGSEPAERGNEPSMRKMQFLMGLRTRPGVAMVVLTRAVLPLYLAGSFMTMRPARMMSTDISSLKVVELKDRLRAAGLKVSGNKGALVERLLQSTSTFSPMDAEQNADGLGADLVISISHCKQ